MPLENAVSGLTFSYLIEGSYQQKDTFDIVILELLLQLRCLSLYDH
jgi:hypothetical protein